MSEQQERAWEAPLQERLVEGEPRFLIAALIKQSPYGEPAVLTTQAWLVEASLKTARRLDETLDKIKAGPRAAMKVGFLDPDDLNLTAPAIEIAQKMGVVMVAVCLMSRGGLSGNEKEAQALIQSWAEKESGVVAEAEATYPNRNKALDSEIMGSLMAAWEAQEILSPCEAPLPQRSRAPGL